MTMPKWDKKLSVWFLFLPTAGSLTTKLVSVCPIYLMGNDLNLLFKLSLHLFWIFFKSQQNGLLI